MNVRQVILTPSIKLMSKNKFIEVVLQKFANNNDWRDNERHTMNAFDTFSISTGTKCRAVGYVTDKTLCLRLDVSRRML